MKVSDVCVYVCLCAYVFYFVLLYSCVLVCDFACVYVVHMYVRVDVYTCVCVRLCMCACVRLRAHTVPNKLSQSYNELREKHM